MDRKAKPELSPLAKSLLSHSIALGHRKELVTNVQAAWKRSDAQPSELKGKQQVVNGCLKAGGIHHLQQPLHPVSCATLLTGCLPCCKHRHKTRYSRCCKKPSGQLLLTSQWFSLCDAFHTHRKEIHNDQREKRLYFTCNYLLDIDTLKFTKAMWCKYVSAMSTVHSLHKR